MFNVTLSTPKVKACQNQFTIDIDSGMTQKNSFVVRVNFVYCLTLSGRHYRAPFSQFFPSMVPMTETTQNPKKLICSGK